MLPFLMGSPRDGFFFFWKGVSVKKSAYMHNTEPIIPALGNGDVIDCWLPQGNPELQGPCLHPHHPSAHGQDK